jgi:hypothetical protein
VANKSITKGFLDPMRLANFLKNEIMEIYKKTRTHKGLTNMTSSRIITLCSVLSLVFLAGCTKNLKYQSRRLTPLTKATAHSSQTKDNVTVSVKSFDTGDQNYYFGKRTENIHPLQISVNNDSKTSWVLSKNNISLPLADSEIVARQYKASGWSTFGLWLLAWPIGIAHGVMSHTANKEIQADIADKNIEMSTVITPEAQRDAVVFSRSEQEFQRFTVTLVDANDPSRTLHFNLHA